MTKYVCFYFSEKLNRFIWEPKYKWVKSEVFESLFETSL